MAIRDNFGPGISLTTNGEGLRIHRPVTDPLGPDERRAICSGDSFTYGSGVGDDDTFCAALEREVPGLNHLFQHADKGVLAEYGASEETFDPATLDDLTAWLVAKAKVK